MKVIDCTPIPPGKKPTDREPYIKDVFGDPGANHDKYCAATRAIYCELPEEESKVRKLKR